MNGKPLDCVATRGPIGKHDFRLFDDLPIQPMPVRSDRPAPMALPPLRIVIDGDPVAKGRPRVRIARMRGKSIPILYPPKETQDYEDRVRRRARKALDEIDAAHAKFYPIDERPIGMIVRVYVPIPISWTKKDTLLALAGELFPLTKPDADNYLKMACDSLNGIVYRDDSLVTDKKVTKRYSENPRMEIEVFV